MSRRLSLLMAVVVPLVTVATAAPASADRRAEDLPTPPPWLRVENGVSQPQFDLANAIEETLFVQTSVDSDHDGKLDRVRLQLSRPGETESQGIKVPVVFEHSPYRYNGGDAANHNVDFDVLPQEGIQPHAQGTGSTRCGARRAAAGAGPARVARQLLGAARLRGRARREHRHRLLRRLPDRRRHERDAGHQGDHRLAERPRAGVERGGRAGRRGLDHRRRRHDRHVLQRHAAQPGGDDGRRGPAHDRAGVGDLQLVRLLPGQRHGARAALEPVRGGRERLPGRGPGHAGVLHRGAAAGALPGHHRRVAAVRGPDHRRLQRLLGRRATTCTARRTSRRACSSCTVSRTTT